MKCFLVDTNVFLRFLTLDVKDQAETVEKRFKQAEKGEIEVKVLPMAVVEILYHLENWYDYDRSKAVDMVLRLLLPEWMQVEHKQAVYEALVLYKSSNIDFVDLVLWAVAKEGGDKVMSFDKDFDKLDPMIRVEP